MHIKDRGGVCVHVCVHMYVCAHHVIELLREHSLLVKINDAAPIHSLSCEHSSLSKKCDKDRQEAG